MTSIQREQLWSQFAVGALDALIRRATFVPTCPDEDIHDGFTADLSSLSARFADRLLKQFESRFCDKPKLSTTKGR